MPAFNCEEYIAKSIDSALLQSFQSWELIVIDDCSTDKTRDIIEEYASRDRRIIFSRNTVNKGASATRNQAIALSHGEWIAFLDSDDLWENDKLEKQIRFAHDHKADFIFTGSSFIDKEGKPFPGVFRVPEKVNFLKLCVQNVISCSSVLIQKRLLDGLSMKGDDIHEDYALWLQILKQSKIFAYGINEPLLVYRISPGSKSGKKIRSIKMTYGVFETLGMNPLTASFFTCCHLLGASVKHLKLRF